MFVGISKTFAKVGGVRIGAGMRLTKKNAVWMLFILMMVWMLKLCWYMVVLCLWIIYAMFYGIYWCIKKSILALKGNR